VGKCGLDASVSGWRAVVDPCEHGTESSASTKRGEFLN
jgi:hypothetical protein